MKTYLGFILAGLLMPSLGFSQQADRSTSVDYFGDWTLSCSQQGEVEACLVTQGQRDRSGATVSVINVSKAGDSTLVEFVLPLMVDLTDPMQLVVADKFNKVLPYNACNQAACFVLENDTTSLLGAFKANTDATMTFKLFGGQTINVNVSLRGFTAAHEALEAKLE